jgi:hypothetical protein
MAKIKKKKPVAKKGPAIKNTRKKIDVRIEGRKKPSLPDPTIETMAQKEIIEKEITFQADDPRLEKSKRIIMWSGVTFFMLLIGSIWIYILTGNINEGANADNNGATAELKENLSKSLSEFKDSMEAFKELKDNIASSSTTTLEKTDQGYISSSTPSKEISDSQASSTIFAPASLPRAANIGTSTLKNKNTGNNDLAELKKKLGELEKKLQEIK